jgi:hypothetical protein
MITTRRVAGACVVASLAMSGVAVAAAAPSVSKERTVSGATAPVTVPGTGVKKGARLPRGDRMVFRTVTLTKGQKLDLTMSTPAGTRLRGLAVAENGRVDFTVVSPRHYVGHRSVKVKAFAAPHTTGTHSGRIFALVG